MPTPFMGLGGYTLKFNNELNPYFELKPELKERSHEHVGKDAFPIVLSNLHLIFLPTPFLTSKGFMFSPIVLNSCSKS